MDKYEVYTAHAGIIFESENYEMALSKYVSQCKKYSHVVIHAWAADSNTIICLYKNGELMKNFFCSTQIK